MAVIDITVYGIPAPQGSKRFVGLGKSGKGKMIESSKAVKPWREAVKWTAMEVMAGKSVSIGASYGPVAGPLRVQMTFTLPKPASAPKKRQKWPDRKPDLSKLVRSTEDALTDAGVWEDDSRVVDLVAAKRYPGEGRDALDRPGAVIRIMAVGT